MKVWDLKHKIIWDFPVKLKTPKFTWFFSLESGPDIFHQFFQKLDASAIFDANISSRFQPKLPKNYRNDVVRTGIQNPHAHQEQDCNQKETTQQTAKTAK